MSNHSTVSDSPAELNQTVTTQSSSTLNDTAQPIDDKKETSDMKEGSNSVLKKESAIGSTKVVTDASDGVQTEPSTVALKPYQGQTQIIPYNNLSSSIITSNAAS
jgi:hypothetical protein